MSLCNKGFLEWYKNHHNRQNCLDTIEDGICNNTCIECEYLYEYWQNIIKK